MLTLSHIQIEPFFSSFDGSCIPEDGDEFEAMVDSITDGVCAALGIKK